MTSNVSVEHARMDEGDDDWHGLEWHDIATVLQCGLRSIGVKHGVLTLAMKCISAPSILPHDYS